MAHPHLLLTWKPPGQPPFDVHRQYFYVSLIDLQARVSRFRCQIFHCLVDFSKISLNYYKFLSLKSYRLMIFLHLDSFENKRFELDFSIFHKIVFLRSNPLRKVKFFHGYNIFLKNSCSFPYTKKTSATLSKKSNMGQQP